MQSPKADSRVGRVAQLRNLVSRPELNGEFVAILRYDNSRNRYEIRTLAAPNNNSDTVSFFVKQECLELNACASFDEQFPNAKIRIPRCLHDGYALGTIFDFSEEERPLVTQPGAFSAPKRCCLIFKDSCRAQGAAVPIGGPHLTIFAERTFSVPDDSRTVVEFSHIRFEDPVTCAGNGSIVFINCYFPSSSGLSFPDGGRTAALLFENCLFDHCKKDLVATQNTHVTLLNCTFRNTILAVKDKGTAVAKFCTFAEGDYTVIVEDKESRMELSQCSISDVDFGVSVCHGGAAVIEGCRIQRAAFMGVRSEGPKGCTIRIQDSVIIDCSWGVSIAYGTSTNINLINTVITKSEFYGVLAKCRGYFTITNCTITENKHNIVNDSYLGCVVMVDDVPHALDERMIPTLDNIADIFSARYRAKYGDGATTMGSLVVEWDRCMGIAVSCANCHTTEPEGVKFQLCSRCRNVYYCSKDCQKAHWKAGGHKQECKSLTYKIELYNFVTWARCSMKCVCCAY